MHTELKRLRKIHHELGQIFLNNKLKFGIS
jgi:hypothetical protein